jgi:hypothetical protein
MLISTDDKISYSEDKSNRPIIAGAFALVLVAAVCPLFIVETPALGDYLNHLARTHIIASIDRDPQLAQYFTIVWHIIPNLAMDIITPLLSHYSDIYLAGKLFVSLTIALIVTGGIAVHYAVYQRLSVAPLVTSLFIYNESLLLGLLNYVFGIGLALWGIAAWIWLRPRSPVVRGTASLAFVLVLFISHLYSVGLYGLALLCFEGWIVCTGRSKGRRLISDVLVLCLPFLIMLPLFMITPTAGLTSVTVWNSLRLKLRAVEWMFELYHPALDFAIVAFVGAVVAWGLARRVLRLHAVGWAILSVGTMVYAIMPTIAFRSLHADYRLPIAILFMVIPFSRWQFTPSRTRLLTVGITGLALFRFTLVGLVWLDIDHAYADLRQAFKQIERGSTILAVSRTDRVNFPFNRAWPLNYAASLATIERSAFVPNLFTLPGAQVLTVKPAYRAMETTRNSLVPNMSKFISAAENPAAARAQGFRWVEWEKHYNYLLVLYTHDQDTNPLPQKLSALSSGYQFQLYRIKQLNEGSSLEGTKPLLAEEFYNIL